MLKLTDYIVDEPMSKTSYQVTSGKFSVTVFYEKEETEEDREAIAKQKAMLESNIARRKNLLSNQGYINKAPKELLEQERIKLEEEEKLLEQLS